MNTDTSFTIYNAAAGAGKTYTLVKSYLITLLKSDERYSYKYILAITFTNKAVAEMKHRILENLVQISNKNTAQEYQGLLNELVEETSIPEEKLKLKAKKVLKNILHNYAGFDVVTIDTFTHRIIRTFAYDLGIPMDFEIEMDVDSLIKEAVDAVVSKIGIDKTLTKLIIDFAYSKLDDDKSWDITLELNNIGKLLFSENDRKHLDNLAHKSIDDFKELKNNLSEKTKATKSKMVKVAKQILQLIDDNGLDITDFTRSSIPKHFIKIAEGDTVIDYKAAWKQNIEETAYYNAKLDDDKKGQIDSLKPAIIDAFHSTKTMYYELHLFQNISKNLTPLTILNSIHKELVDIKRERKILLISEFNSIISDAIQGQPTPFIYERLGERYRDYFIDEFQDTSELQWKNLVPLVDNAISAESYSGQKGHVTIVGDAKQAIYRWRGGKAEQFIELSSDYNPFSTQDKAVLNLPKNYRSHEEIINFNNELFTFLANDLKKTTHRDIYIAGNKQETNTKKGGYVDISFIEAKTKEEEHLAYPEKIYEIINKCVDQGYRLNEICIIVRKQKEGTVIANYLTQEGISIISSETLLIKNAPQVNFIIDILTISNFNQDLNAKLKLLHFLAGLFNVEDETIFLQKLMPLDMMALSEEFKKYHIQFDFNELLTKPLYDTVEYICTAFKLAETTTAYVQFFLDVVFSYTQKNTDGVLGFLDYWKTNKDKLSIIAPDAEDAIQIMTIHKAKGLEFPCVIYPYANTNMYYEIEPKTWLDVSKEDYNDFNEVFINYSKNIAEYGNQLDQIVKDREAQLELDAYNLLYVVLTRAKEQLFILSKLDLTIKGEHKVDTFSGKFISYLKHKGDWLSDKTNYSFGNPLYKTLNDIVKKEKSKEIKLSSFSNSGNKYRLNVVCNESKLWDTSQQNAIEKGNIIHDLMASIYTAKDLDKVIEEGYNRSMFTLESKEIVQSSLEKIINHPKLKKYFNGEHRVLNEKDIISKNRVFRPDRLNLDINNNCSIIDYKTGVYNSKHEAQIDEYASILKEMNYNIVEKILVYINDEITLKYV